MTPPTSPPPLAHESLATRAVKALLHMAALGAIGWELLSHAGLLAGAVGVVLATTLAAFGHRAGLRTSAALLLGLGGASLGFLGASFVRGSVPLASALGVAGTVAASDALMAGVGLGSILFTLRLLAQRHALAATLEVIAIAFAASYLLLDHRELNLHHPRFFADFLLSQGLDPVIVLKAFGVAIMVGALVMLLKSQGAAKGLFSMLIAALVGLLVFLSIKDAPPLQPARLASNALAGEGEDESGQDEEDQDGEGGGDKDGEKDKDGEGGGGGGGQGGDGPGGSGGGNSKNPLKNPPPQSQPQPVALVTFHEELETPDGLLYFRQQALSHFNGSHLAADTSGQRDTDVLTTYPHAGPVEAPPVQDPSAHVLVPTSMFLMADHPQPVALSHAVSLSPLPNPNPRLFVASYAVTSRMPTTGLMRLVGRDSPSATWDAATRAHYLSHPDDPRYKALADEILRDLDIRFQGDALLKAFAIKRHLEKEGFYTLKERYEDETDPTAAFLFGSMRGYCVHFAHSAVFLFRAVGIAARVAVGYAADTSLRAPGSSMLILGNQAHAWPEIHLDGIGWVTFDIHPERSDQPPAQVIDQDLANMLGEIARDDPSGGRASNPNRGPFPWGLLGLWGLLAFGALLGASYLVTAVRRLAPAVFPTAGLHRHALRAANDRLAALGLARDPGESRERYARRVASSAPSLIPLTALHLRRVLGPPSAPPPPAAEVRGHLSALSRELRASQTLPRRILALLHPAPWLRSR